MESRQDSAVSPRSEFLDTSEVGALFGVDRKTVIRWADAGRIPHTRTLGGHRRFLRTEVEALVAESRREVTA